MTTPQLLPMLKPFAEAVAFQRERVAMTRDEFDELSNEARLRAFTIAGLTRKSLIESAQFEAMQAISDGLTKSEFLERLGKVLDAQGGTFFSPRRLELIAQNNMATAYAAGRHRQMSHPDVVEERPWRQYPLGPHDARTSEICRKLEGLVARYDDPIWNHITPPNHHNERHIKVLTLTDDQARESGKLYESPADLEYPVIDGQTMLPDPGFDYQPGLVTADDRALIEAATKAGEILPAKTAADYGLETLAEADIETLPAAPKVTTDAIADVADSDEYERAWQSFRDALGFPSGADQMIVVDAQGDGVRVTRGTFDHMLGLDADEEARNQKKDRPRFFSRIVPALEEPFESWMLTRANAGELAFTKRHIALFSSGGRKPSAFVLYADLSSEGWLMETGFAASPSNLEALRVGRLLHSNARRQR